MVLNLSFLCRFVAGGEEGSNRHERGRIDEGQEITRRSDVNSEKK